MFLEIVAYFSKKSPNPHGVFRREFCGVFRQTGYIRRIRRVFRQNAS